MDLNSTTPGTINLMRKWIFDHFFQILSATGTILGAWALIRTYLLSRPKLRLVQQNRWGKNYSGSVNSERRIGITLLVCNPRPQPNVVVEWTAFVQSENGPLKIPVPSGDLVGTAPQTPYGVIPLTIPAFGAVEATLCLFEIPNNIPRVQLTVVAADVHKKRYKLKCDFTEKSKRS
jgi:hypothetical protein